MKREGALAGVSDIFLPVARGGYHGLYIELKVKGGKLSTAQEWWLWETECQGYCSKVCFGWIEAKEVIEKYLGGGLKTNVS
ncbi:VRR-NUC domain protein [Desulfosporosinus sp. OT]|nr:VRR-NUC domain protein [Desulfosporosinus sp. OT]